MYFIIAYSIFFRWFIVHKIINITSTYFQWLRYFAFLFCQQMCNRCMLAYRHMYTLTRPSASRCAWLYAAFFYFNAVGGVKGTRLLFMEFYSILTWSVRFMSWEIVILWPQSGNMLNWCIQQYRFPYSIFC